MTEFTNGELKLLFQRIDEKLDDIKGSMTTQHARYDKEIADLRFEVKETKEDVEQLDKSMTRIMAIGGTVWSAITLLGGFILNRIF